MSNSISALLIRNLSDVFGENVGGRPSTNSTPKIACSSEPKGVYHGRDEIDRVAGAIKVTHPDFQYQPIAPPEELGNTGRVPWISGRLGEPPA